MEPSGTDLHRHSLPAAVARHLTPAGGRAAAVTAASALVLTSSGDAVVLAAALALAAGEAGTALAAALALAAACVRWGTTSLDVVSGAQAVLGPGAVVGPALATASSWCAAAALVLAGAGRRAEVAAAFGATAALVLAGPSITDAGSLLVRGGAAVMGAGAAVALQRWSVPPARPLALVLGAAGLVLALAA